MVLLTAFVVFQGGGSLPSVQVASNLHRPDWEAKVSVPRLKTASGKALVAAVAKSEKAAMEAWVGETKISLKDYRPGRIQTYEAEPDYAYERGRVASVRTLVFWDNAGAHPNTVYREATFWDGRPAKLADFFSPGIDAARAVSYALFEKLLKNPQAMWVADGTVRELTPAQLEQFVVTPKGLQWTFSPYELGPYAAGTIQERLSPAELGRTFRASMLQGR